MNGSLKMLLRTLSRNKLFSIINVIGLSVGLAVAMLIFMLVYNELSFDRSFPDYKRIYRINTVWQDHRLGTKTGMTPAGLAPIIRESVPGVEAVVRGWNRGHIVKTDTYEKDMRIIFVEQGFFDLFPTPVLYGSFEDALSRPNGVALSETQAVAMYGEGDPVGKTFLYGPTPMEVRAVFRDYPTNTSMVRPIYSTLPNGFDNPRMQQVVDVDTWLLLNEQADPQQITDRLNEIAADVFKDLNCTFELMPLKDMHLRPRGAGAYRVGNPPGDLTQVRLFSILAVVILLIVCINYMNLSTAQAQKRLREIGLNKILGAQRGTIVVRSYLESAILTFVAFVIAFVLFYVLLPDFSTLMGGMLTVEMIGDPKFLLGLALLFIVTILASASYSAWYLSGFPPALAVKKGGTTYKVLRQVLSVAQFAVAIVLITWVIVIKTQTSYIYSKDLGYNPDELVGFWVRTAGSTRSSARLAFEEELRRLPSVQETSSVSNFPGMEEVPLFKIRSEETEAIQMKYISADEHITDLLGLKVIAGRALPPAWIPLQNGPADTLWIGSAMLNERAVAALDMTPEEIVGRQIFIGDEEDPLAASWRISTLKASTGPSPLRHSSITAVGSIKLSGWRAETGPRMSLPTNNFSKNISRTTCSKRTTSRRNSKGVTAA